MISKELQAFLSALSPDDMPPGIHDDLSQLLSGLALSAPVHGPAEHPGSGLPGGCIRLDSASSALEDVWQSFMKMAPRAFELGNMMDRNVVNRLKPLSKEQEMELWAKIWSSFDFNDSQCLDV